MYLYFPFFSAEDCAETMQVTPPWMASSS